MKFNKFFPPRIIVFILCAIFVLLTSLKLHGYSISRWRGFTDQSEPKEILLGKARGVRSDDYLVGLPFMLSQTAHKPSFPVNNHLIGENQNMLLVQAPVRHWVIFFKPHLWGYFMGDDWGLAWNWWFNTVGLLISFFLVFCLISGNRVHLSLLASGALVFSPFTQFWSLNCAALCIFMALSFIFAVRLIFSPSKGCVISYSLLLGWSGTSFVFQFYPPYQVALSYLFLFMLGGYTWKKWQNGYVIRNPLCKLSGLFLSVCIVISLTSLLYLETRDVFHIVMNTDYPGQRVEGGGGYRFWLLFSNIFVPWPEVKDWHSLGNACEASSFLLFFPVTGFLVLMDLFRTRKIRDPFSFMVVIYLLILYCWILYGFTPLAGKWTLFSLMPSYRSKLGLGFADMILLVSLLSQSNEMRFISKKKWMILATGICLICMVLIGRKTAEALPAISNLRVVLGALFTSFAAFLILWKSKHAITVITLYTIYLSIWFNPLVQGGTSLIKENNLSKEILELNRQNGENTTWISYDSLELANLFRRIGVKALNGVHFFPQFEMWGKLDPEMKFKSVYNRYAHVIFKAGENPDEIKFANPRHDVVVVTIHPDHPLFPKLQADFIITNDSKAFDQAQRLDKVLTMGDKHIYRVKK